MSDEINKNENEAPEVQPSVEPTEQISEKELDQVAGGSKLTQAKNDMQKGIIAQFRV